ncbi:MAG TPA: hypothetical protein VG324_18565, partial [Blastocatellia bacterium]|nr:hypothetical protein [Blastocatellia bacterium]
IAVAHGDGAYLELGVAGEQRYDAGAYRSQAKNAKNRFCSHNQRSLTGEGEMRNLPGEFYLSKDGISRAKTHVKIRSKGVD